MIQDFTMNNSPVRNINCYASFFDRDTYNTVLDCDCTNYLKSLSIERVGEEGKFFGFGVSHKVNIKLLDINREIDIKANNYMFIHFDDLPPTMFATVTEVHRDEVTNELSITAYDDLYLALSHTVDELELPTSYTIADVAAACGKWFGSLYVSGIEEEIIPFPVKYVGDFGVNNPFLLEYPEGANLEGTETIRELLDDIAEATQTIYYLYFDFYSDEGFSLCFKRLSMEEEPALTITKDDYFELTSSTNRRLGTIANVTELGDNVAASTDASGSTQYIRDNAFWALREDIDILVEDALAATGGLTLNQFECNWRGNYLLEIGDKIALITKDNETVYSYLVDDVINFDGTYSQHTRWHYPDGIETEANPSNLGDALKKTFARVDKANAEIEIVANETAIIKMSADSINQSVIKTDETIAELKNEVNTRVTAEQVQYTIENELLNGVDKVTTATGFTFDGEGLKIEKSDSELSTQITEDGMQISNNGHEVLKVNNQGIKAEDLHAVTYLIIGNNTRIEDYNGKTGCFWIGG